MCYYLNWSLPWSIKPPSQPMFPYLREQSTKFCSDNETSCEAALKCWPSNEATAEKAQHEPHCPWSLIGVTYPWVLNIHRQIIIFISNRKQILNLFIINILPPVNRVWDLNVRWLQESSASLLDHFAGLVVAVEHGNEFAVGLFEKRFQSQFKKKLSKLLNA